MPPQQQTQIPAPIASPRGQYKVGDEVTMYNRVFTVSKISPDGSPVLDLKPGQPPQKEQPQAQATPTPVQPGGPTVRVIGPSGEIYEMSKNEADDWTSKHSDWRTMPSKKEDTASKYDPEKFAGGLFGPPKGLEWLIPGTHLPLRAAHMGFEALGKWGEKSSEDVRKLGEKGVLTPGQTGVMSYPGGFLKDTGKVGAAMTEPSSALMAGASIHPLGRAAVGTYMAGSGGAGAWGDIQNMRKQGIDDKNLQSFLFNLSGMSAGLAGMKESVPKVKGSMKPSPETLARQSGELITKGTTVAKPDFQPKLQRTIERGHLTEIEKKYHPGTVREAADAVSDYMNNYLEKNVKEPLLKQSGIISGDAIVEGLNKLKTAETEVFSPEDLKTIEKEIERYKGKNVQASVAYEHLKRLNQMTSKLRQAAPQNAAGAARVNARIRANVSAAAILREQLYAKMEQLGQPIKDFNEDYGALTSVQKHLWNNIGRADKIGKGESLGKEYMRGHNPWLVLGGLTGAGFAHSETLAGATVAIPFLRWVMQRRGTPNAMIDRAFGKAGKLPGAAPSQGPPPPAAGQLPRGPIPLGPQVEPIEDVGPTSQSAKPGRPARTPKGKKGAGQMRKTYTTSSTFNRPEPRTTGGDDIDPSKVPPVSGGSQKSETVGSSEGAAADTSDFNEAKRLLGDKGSENLSHVLQVAQELKHMRMSKGIERASYLKMFEKFVDEGEGKGTYMRDARTAKDLLERMREIREANKAKEPKK